MTNQDLMEKNPLRALYPKDDAGPRMGLVISRAGLGKTAILVQIALDRILCGKKVLHVSIGQNLEKTKTWYDDIFKAIVTNLELGDSLALADAINRNRLIMTFNASSFSRPKLEERLNDLVYQNIFTPDCIIIDGLDFFQAARQAIADLRELAEALQSSFWFSATRRREDQRTSDTGVPAPCHEVEDLFDTIVLLRPDKDDRCIGLDVLKDTTPNGAAGKVLNLDPATLMLKDPFDRC